MTIKRDYYPISEAVQMIGCTEDDLIHLGAKWRISIYALFDHEHQASKIVDGQKVELKTLSHGPYELLPFDLQAYEAGKKHWLTSVYLGKSWYELLPEHSGAPLPLPSRLVIMSQDIEDLQGEKTSNDSYAITTVGTNSQRIKGKTFSKLITAIEAYSEAYADKRPKLDDDLRPWLREKFECTEREASVFGAIIAEHFGLK